MSCARPLVLVSAVGLATGVPAWGQGYEPEHLQDPPAAVLPTATSIPNIGMVDGPGFFLSQVNVNAAGLNIVGDAANEPSLAVDPTAPNRLVIGWRQFDSVTSNFRQAGRAWSNDGGRNWHNIGVFTPGIFRSDPVLDADADGRIFYLDIQSSFCSDVFKSLDGGRTWAGPTAAFGGDKEWLAIDTTAGPGRGFLYQSWTSYYPCTVNSFTRSTDAGSTWMPPTFGSEIWGTLAVGPTGTLYSCDQGSYVARSTDAHIAAATPTFSGTPVNLGGSGIYGGTPNPGGLGGQGWVAVDRSGGPRNGWVYFLCSVSAGDPADVMVNRSTDGGATWLATPIRVNNDPPGPNAWQWFGTMSVAPSGRIDVVWNDTRESQNPVVSRVYYASSNDGGNTWQGNIPLTQPFDSTIGWPNQNKIGDYYHLRSDRVGASLAFAATFNGEQDVYFLRINDWDCNGNGVADTLDLQNGTETDCNGNGIPDSCERAAGVVVPCPCYANCDGSTAPPVLNVADFTCFLQRFAAGDPYANCDGSTAQPVLNVADFTCFLQRFAAGCP